MSTEAIIREFQARLSAVRTRRERAALLHAAALSCLLLAMGAMLALGAEALFGFGTAVRTALDGALMAASLALLVFRIWPPLGRLAGIAAAERDIETARRVGRALPAVGDRLADSLQLAADTESGRLYSAELLEAALADVYASCREIDFASTVDTSGARHMGRLLAGGIAAALLLLVLLPTAFFGAADRLFHYGVVYASSPRFRLLVEPGSREVVRGERVDVRVRVLGETPAGLRIAFRRKGDLSYDEAQLLPDNAGTLHHEFASLGATTEYYVHASGVRTDDYTLTVMDRPLVRLLRVTVTPPAYSALPARVQDDNAGDVSALKGSRVRFDVQSSRPLRSGTIALSDSASLPLAVEGTQGRGTLLLMKERTYHVGLTDLDGTPSADPVEYTLRIIPDAPPAVTILAPGENLDVTDTAAVGLLAKITDDYGFSGLRLAYKLVQSRYASPAASFSTIPLPLPPRGSTEALVPYRWSVASLHLVPEDVVSYYVEVFDNDAVSGPKSAMSEIYSLRLPSMDEVFAQADRDQSSSIAGMQEALQKAEEAHREMEDLKESVKASGDKLQWQDRQKAADMLKQEEEVRARMDSLHGAVDRMAADLERNQVLSPQTLAKYQELQHLMVEMSTPEMAEAMKQLQQAMEQMNPDALRQAMQQFSLSEETFRKSIERTMNLLRRIQIEQKVDEAVRRAQALIREQDRLAEATAHESNSRDGGLDSLARAQSGMKENVDSLASSMASLQQKMEEFPSEMPLGELEQARREMAGDSVAARMEESAADLGARRPGEASRAQQQSLASLRRLGQHLDRMQQDMLSRQQQQILGAMRRSMRDLLDLSRRQEDLKNESEGLEPNSRRFRDDQESQMNLMRDLGTVAEGLSSLSQKTFGVTPEMGKAIGDAMRDMNSAMRSLGDRNRAGASQQQTDAMGSLNDAAQKVADAIDAMSQSGGQGMGMAGFMQRLRRLSAQQGGINGASRNLGAMTPEQAASMARLAGEQGMVRKSLEQLSREAAAAGELKKLAGDLRQTMQEMTEVESDLMSGKFNEETARKEDRILSRLLDAQRSTRERDFEQRRTSTAGRDVARESPAAIDLSTLEGRNRLRRDMQKALEGGYAREYEELIRRYFEILEQTDTRPR
ncbi:MAG TPA: DUF4175 family protein [Bacteroidota bacterium]|nr:DUF4175 family protein [Bacteroidota bacterium]